MAIEMIRRGQVPEEKKYEGRCNRCMSVYEAKLGDLTHTSHRNEDSYHAVCLLTGCFNTVYFNPKPPTGR